MTAVPQSDDADYEKIATISFCLLGWICVQNDLLDSLDFLQKRHFIFNNEAEIFEKMREMRTAGLPITPMAMEQQSIDNPNGIRKYLIGAIKCYNQLFYPIEEAKVLVEMANKHHLLCLFKETVFHSAGKTSGEIMEMVTSGFDEIEISGSKIPFQTEKQVTRRIIDRLNNRPDPISTGIRKLDQAMDGGLVPGFNYLFAARKKTGKTTLASSISYNLGKNHVRHLYICAEMSDLEIHQRNLARHTHSYSNSFRSDIGRSPQFISLLEEEYAESNNAIVYLSMPGIPLETLKIAVARAMKQYRIEGFILDSLQLVGGKSSKKNQAEHQDEVSQWCADFGRQHNLFSIITAQINQTGGIRGGEGIRLSCDQGYELHAPNGDASRSVRWLEMIETRYTAWMDIGDENSPPLTISENGPHIYDESDNQENLQF